MFGFICAIGALLGWASDARTNSYVERQNRKAAVNEYMFGSGNSTYLNAKGDLVDLVSGKKIYKTEMLGHTVYLDGMDGDVVRDITQEKIDKRREWDRISGKKAGIWMDNAQLRALWEYKFKYDYENDSPPDYYTDIYIHFATGKLCYKGRAHTEEVSDYFKKKYNFRKVLLPSEWYIDIITNELLDVVDWDGKDKSKKYYLDFRYIINRPEYDQMIEKDRFSAWEYINKQECVDNSFLEELKAVYNNLMNSNLIYSCHSEWRKLYL